MASSWRCILCENREHEHEVRYRDGSFCAACDSTWRVRATALALITGLGYPPQPLPEIASDWSRRGVGLTDHASLAAAISGRFDYTNTYLHRYPRLDLLDVPDELKGQLEFVICSDVLEHVPQPVELAVQGLRALLRPGGFAVVSVPLEADSWTEEFYPGLVAWEVDALHRVRWVDNHRQVHLDEHPDFHGGVGQTLAFRRFTAASFTKCLVDSGFAQIGTVPVATHLGVSELDSGGVFIAYR